MIVNYLYLILLYLKPQFIQNVVGFSGRSLCTFTLTNKTSLILSVKIQPKILSCVAKMRNPFLRD